MSKALLLLVALTLCGLTVARLRRRRKHGASAA
jgi:hypothetical protein